MDVTLGGEDVDIKTTMHKNWMFSKSSLNRINLLIVYNEDKAKCDIGLIYVEENSLNPSQNRDEKRNLKKGDYWKVFVGKLKIEAIQKTF